MPIFSDNSVAQILGFGSLALTGVLAYLQLRNKGRTELALAQVQAASALAIIAANKVDTVAERVDTVAAAQIVVADKVETVAVTAGVAANRALATQREVRAGVESRTQLLAGVVEAVEANKIETAEIKKIAIDIHTLSNGTMGVALETGLEAAQGRYEATPTPENKVKLDMAIKKFEEHAAKERIIEAKNATPPGTVDKPPNT